MQPEVTDLPKPGRQDMLQEPADELHRLELHDVWLVRVAVTIAQGDPINIMLQDGPV